MEISVCNYHGKRIAENNTMYTRLAFYQSYIQFEYHSFIYHSLLTLSLFCVCFITKSFLTCYFFHLHLLYQPYVGLCQATCVQSHRRQPRSAVAIATCEVNVSAAES